MSNANLNKIDN